MRGQGSARAAASPAANVNDVVEALGMGLAQLRVLILGVGVWFTDGIDICIGTVVTPTIAHEFGLSHSQRGLLTTFTMLGIATGCFLSTFLGDSFGRRVPIIASYFIVVVFNITMVLASSFGVILVARVGIGVAMGIGMSPSLAMMSETTPSAWRMAMAGAKGVVAVGGCVFVNIIAMISDPLLIHLEWRKLYLFCSLPSTFLCVGSFFFLPESPVFLASMGRHRGADKVLASMRQLNRRHDVSLDYNIHRGGGSHNSGALSFMNQIRVIYGPGLIKPSLVALLVNSAINLIQYSNNYGEPLVLTSGFAHLSLRPGQQLLMANCFGMLGLPFTILASWLCSRRNGITLCFVTVSTLTAMFAATVTSNHRSQLCDACFQISMCGLRIIFAVTWNFVHQFSVEIYPVAASATGGALAIGLGRFGSIVAPEVFECLAKVTNRLISCYYVMAVVGLVLAVAINILVPKSLDEIKVKAQEDIARIMANISSQEDKLGAVKTYRPCMTPESKPNPSRKGSSPVASIKVPILNEEEQEEFVVAPDAAGHSQQNPSSEHASQKQLEPV